MKIKSLLSSLALSAVVTSAVMEYAFADSKPGAEFIVKDGKPRAEIIISENPVPVVKLAARELQAHLKKISGAELAINSSPGKDVPVQIYVGGSQHTDKLGVVAEGLKHGAFKMVSGPNYLILLGQDDQFVPHKPYLSGFGKGPKEKVLQEYDALTKEHWEYPFTEFAAFNKELGISDYDHRGSLNAVYEFLRGLGVRWYLPGELGEVIPKMADIPVPQIDKTVRPDFAVRDLGTGYNPIFCMDTQDFILWHLRLGLDRGQDVLGYGWIGHGIDMAHMRDEVKKAHPEYYALVSGKRNTGHGQSGAPCLSSPGLFEQNVKMVRFLFDTYNEPLVSVMPCDAYAGLCECELCAGKGTPERGYSGQLSDYVWDYVNRVAKELYKTHPDRKISCFAYGTYQLPPKKIDKLSPNVVVGLTQGRTGFGNPKTFQEAEDLRKAWREKLGPGQQMLFWNYYLTSRSSSQLARLPVFFPHAISKDLRSLKGHSLGETVELTREGPTRDLNSPGFNQLNAYVTACLYWDADQDIDALLDEYYQLYYGPAAERMKAFVDHSEANWPYMTKKPEPIAKALELLAAARAAAGDGIYGKRVELLAEYVKPIEQLRARLAVGRVDVPDLPVTARQSKEDLKIDGNLDEQFWKTVYASYALRDLETGREPDQKTTVRAAWAGNGLCLAIRCEERGTSTMNIAGKLKDDPSIWEGDAIELLVETQAHSYYQITINPAGLMADIRCKDGARYDLWSSHAEVATQVGEREWTVEIFLPAAGDKQDEVDPLNGVAGREPTGTYPWFVNICRQRIRPDETQLSATSPTGKPSFHELMKFGKLYVK